MRWFRFYDDALNNPKVQRLSGDLYKAWGNLLCVASKNGGRLPPVNDLAFALRVTEQKAQGWLDILVQAGLFDRSSDGIRPHDWDEWQRESDSAAERMRRHRNRKRDSTNGVTVTSPVQNSDGAEQNRLRAEEDSVAKATAPSGAPDLKKFTFGPCLTWLAQQTGKEASQHRSMVGKWCRDYGEAAVIEAIGAAQRVGPIEPVGWITKALKERARQQSPPAYGPIGLGG